MKSKSLLSIGLTLLMAWSFKTTDIAYFNKSALALKVDTTRAIPLPFHDLAGPDTLYQQGTKEGVPVAYYRPIQAELCLDKQCLPVHIILYWNITGRYLGFKLPPGEVLTKTDHRAFSTMDYEQLHSILSDPQSPIAFFSEKELVKRHKPIPKSSQVDAITTATIPALTDHVVRGAAYTSYQLWHLIYGPTQQEIERQTIQGLSVPLAESLLSSPNEQDQIWVLNHLRGRITSSPSLCKKIISLIDERNYSLADRAIQALDPALLSTDSLQISLLQRFYASHYSLQLQILNRLSLAPTLSDVVEESLANHLPQLSTGIISEVIDLYTTHKVSDEDTYKQLSLLLKGKNRFISKKTYEFLHKRSISDKQVRHLLQEYAKAT